MKNITLPQQIIVGKNILENITSFTKNKKCLVITGNTTRKIAGDKIATLIDSDLITVSSATQEETNNVTRELQGRKIDIAIAVGGGKIIDVTKLAAHSSNTEYISVPTNCANDGIASPRASIKHNNSSVSVLAKTPLAILTDVQIIKEAPSRFIKAGIGDSIAKYSAVRDWKLGHVVKGEYYGDYASKLSYMIGEIVLENAYDISQKTDRGIGLLIESLISSGAVMGIAGSSRPASGSEHKISHSLDALGSTALHGEQTGLGTIIAAYLHGEDWQRIRNALKSAGCATTAKELKIDDDMMIRAVVNATSIKPDRYTILEHVRINKEIAENALKETGVI